MTTPSGGPQTFVVLILGFSTIVNLHCVDNHSMPFINYAKSQHALDVDMAKTLQSHHSLLLLHQVHMVQDHRLHMVV